MVSVTDLQGLIGKLNDYIAELRNRDAKRAYTAIADVESLRVGMARAERQIADDLSALIAEGAITQLNDCQGSINGYVKCELEHGHAGPCGYSPAQKIAEGASKEHDDQSRRDGLAASGPTGSSRQHQGGCER